MFNPDETGGGGKYTLNYPPNKRTQVSQTHVCI